VKERPNVAFLKKNINISVTNPVTARLCWSTQSVDKFPDITAEHVARMGERRGAYRALVVKPERRRPLERHRRRWEDNIKMDFREVGWRAWTGLIWLRIGTGGGPL
jgi:hypothetical protein